MSYHQDVVLDGKLLVSGADLEKVCPICHPKPPKPAECYDPFKAAQLQQAYLAQKFAPPHQWDQFLKPYGKGLTSFGK